MLTAEESLLWAAQTYPGKLALVTSFQREGMAILDMASRLTPGLPVFTLDTGRLPESTFRMIETVRERYGIAIQLISPDPAELLAMTAAHGPNLFHRDVPFRLLCCHVRKVRPLAQALQPFEATLVGLRREQSESRASLKQIDTAQTPAKIAPLADWSAAEVAQYTALHGIPQHPLYAEGYRSIGCSPCTRAVQPGEPERAGRWWWESEADVKECGLHFTPDGGVRRSVDLLLEEVLASRV